MSSFANYQIGGAGSGNVDRVASAIALASRRTGVDFGYLMGQAQIESSLNPTARASTSSATGLYQFIDQSWLSVLNEHGEEYGLGWASEAIQQNSAGRYYVSDPTLRQQIMDLRKHPETASVMAAQHAADNKAYLEQRIGREAEPVDLYLAHFLGAGGAAKFLSSGGNAIGASVNPAAARANRNIFYDRQGNPRTVAQIRASFADKLERGANQAGASTQFAGSADDYSLPGANRVQPADYVRIEQQRLARQTGVSAKDMITPTPDTARMAYLMLATYGR